MSGGFPGTCVGISHPLVVGGDLWGALRWVGCALGAGHSVCSLQSYQFIPRRLCR